MDKLRFPSKKWFENYWYYYKIHTLAAIFILFIVGYSVVECVNKVEPDATVTYIGGSYVSDALQEAFRQYVAEYVEDVDKDGKKTVFFSPIVIPLEAKSEQDFAMAQRAQLELAVGETFLFFLNEQYYDLYAEQGLFIDLAPYTGGGTPVFGVPANDIEGLKSIGFNFSEPVYACVRVLTQGDEGKPKKVAAQQNAIKILTKLLEK